VKVATTKSQRKLFFNLRKAKKNLSWLNQEETEAVARDLGVTPHQVTEMEKRMSARDMTFDATPDTDGDGAGYGASNFLPASDADPAQIVEAEDWEENTQRRLAAGLSTLDDRSRDIIQRRWMADGKETLQDLATEYGVSAERIRQIENNAIKKLRQQVAG
jgi:RNA polymerase sigma-32 factor